MPAKTKARAGKKRSLWIVEYRNSVHHAFQVRLDIPPFYSEQAANEECIDRSRRYYTSRDNYRVTEYRAVR